MAIYMKFGSIKGSVTATGFKEWIEVHSFQWGVGRGISTPVGSAKDREASAPSVSEVVVTKVADIASHKLLEEALFGSGLKVEIAFTTTVKDKTDQYLIFEGKEAMVSGFSMSSGGDRPSESVSLNFTHFQWKFKENSDEGAKLGGAATVAYDIGKAQKG